jgi:hypothetical protein
MKVLACIAVAAVLTLPVTYAGAQAAKPKPAATATAELQPFAGRWVMNNKKSKIVDRIQGVSSAVIIYDGKTWTYIHRHQASEDEEPEAWQATYTVNSPTMHVAESAGDITFRSRIARVGKTMVMTEVGTTLHNQQVHTTIKYELQDDGNTLVETEKSVGPLGPQTNIYVLEREGTGASGLKKLGE